MTQGTCPHCGSKQLVKGIRVRAGGDAGNVGLDYYPARLIFHGREPLLADLCRDCGTVARMWVQKTDRKWYIPDK